jgi:hypothetical protein
MTTTSAAPLGAVRRQSAGSPAAGMSGIEACWLCGTRQPAASMVADGGPACADVRWYCADTQSCTHRWTRAPQSLRTR